MIQINFNYSGSPTPDNTPYIRSDTKDAPVYMPIFESENRLYYQLFDYERGTGGHLVQPGQPEIDFLIPNGTSEAGLIGLPDLVLGGATSIGVSGTDFIINGKPKKLPGITSFRLLQKLINGEDVDSNISQFKELGFISPRIFCRCINLFSLEPGILFDTSLKLLTEKLNKAGLIPQYEILVDCWQMNSAQQLQFYTRCADVLRGSVVLFDLVNEFDTRWQNINPGSFPKLDQLLSSRGSGGSATNPPLPAWDYASFHPRRDDKWLQSIPKDSVAIIDGWPAYGGVHCPLYYDEPKGFAPTSRADRSNNPYDAFRLGNMLALWTAGGVFHSDAGMQSNVLVDTELECARQFIRGLNNGSF